MSTSKDKGTPDSTEESAQEPSAKPADEKADGTESTEAKAAGTKKTGTKKTGSTKARGAKKAGSKGSTKGAKKVAREDEQDADEAKPSKRRRRGERPQPVPGMNPVWWAPVMCTLMVVGLLWIVAFYLLSDGTDNTWPIPGIGYGNLAVGFALIMAGFLMTTRWK